MIPSAVAKFMRSERAPTRSFVETYQRGVFANSVVINPPPHPSPASGGGSRPRSRVGQRPEASILRVRSHRCSRYGLDQHGAALAAADAFGGDALLDAEPLHGVDAMQHDAVAARAHGMAEADCTSVHVKFVTIDTAGRTVKAEHLAAERVVLPGGETGEHLCGEGFVELPQPDVGERERMPAQERGRAQHRAEPHDR